MRARNLTLALTLVGLAGLIPGTLLPADAIPAFARKYGFECTMCHSNYPRLNDFGTRFRQNGYRLPGREEDEKTVTDTSAPFAMRTSVGYNYDRFTNTPGAADVNQPQINGLDVLSGGLLDDDIGYFMIYTPPIPAAAGVAGQAGSLEMANVVFSDLGSKWLNVRIGRFEPAYAAFSAKRSLTFSPYEAYDFTFPNGLAISETQTGIEVTGYGREGFSYAAGWVAGSGTNAANDKPSDYYVRVAKVFGQGEGQTAGQRVGLVAYLGKARPDATLPAAARQSFRRVGLDVSLNPHNWNLSGQYLTGSDPAPLWNSAGAFNFTGGFAEVTYLPRTKIVGFARYDWVTTPAFFNQNVARSTVGARFYLRDNIALHLEYSRRWQNGAPAATENFLTLRADAAF